MGPRADFSRIITFRSINSSGTIPPSRHALGYRLDDMQRQKRGPQQSVDETARNVFGLGELTGRAVLSSSSNPFAEAPAPALGSAPRPAWLRRSPSIAADPRAGFLLAERPPSAAPATRPLISQRRSQPSPFLRLGIETPRPIGKSDEQVTDELARRLVGEAALVVGLVLCLGDHHLRPVECFLHALCAYPDQVAQASLLQFGTEHLADGLGAFHVQGFAEDLLRTSA